MQPSHPRRGMLRTRTWLIAMGVFALAAWLVNTSALAPIPQGGPKIISHRGVYHLYDKVAAAGRDSRLSAPSDGL
jgi:glycerophosphoryl diester phosphodiesterase